MDGQPELRTLAQAGVELGVRPTTLRVQLHRGRLNGTKIGNTWVITVLEMNRYRLVSLGRPGRRAKA